MWLCVRVNETARKSAGRKHWRCEKTDSKMAERERERVAQLKTENYILQVVNPLYIIKLQAIISIFVNFFVTLVAASCKTYCAFLRVYAFSNPNENNPTEFSHCLNLKTTEKSYELESWTQADKNVCFCCELQCKHMRYISATVRRFQDSFVCWK